jgi:peptidoglycan/LPS O-acetylase OafA/YrhL
LSGQDNAQTRRTKARNHKRQTRFARKPARMLAQLVADAGGSDPVLRNEEARPPPSGQVPYLAGIDGLRALAVLAVLVYHARPSWLPGGFLGVEVFFVISGFLITRSLLEEWQRTGTISLRGFWLRRARRLLPALFLLLAAVMTYAFLFEAEALSSLRVDVLAALGYVTNWQLILDHESYFESFQKPSMLRHLWSLAVEEQFYIVWPVILAAGLRFGSKRLLLIFLIVCIAASALAMAVLYNPGGDASRVYYGTDTRASGLLCGAALAFCINSRATFSRGWSIGINLLGVLSLALLGAIALSLHDDQSALYKGGFLLAGLATIAMLLPLTRPGPLSGLLGCAPLRWLGQRSYGIYLWHWPVSLLTWPSEASLATVGTQLFATVALATVSYELVERPVRTGAISRALGDVHAWPELSLPRRAGLMVAGTCLAVALPSLVGVGLLAKTPEAPAYLKLESLRLRTEVDAESGGAMPESALLRRAQSGVNRMSTRGCSPPGGSTFVSAGCGVLSGGTQAPDPMAAAPATAGPPEPPPEVTQAPASATPPPKSRVPASVRVTAIGDSVMLGAATELAASIASLDIDATISRQTSDIISLLRQREATGYLGNVVVVHAGNNGTITTRQFDEIMAVIGPDRRVVFLNVQVPKTWQDSNNAVIGQSVQRYANATIVDWFGASAGNAELFIRDGVHLTRSGAELFTRLVVAAITGN